MQMKPLRAAAGEIASAKGFEACNDIAAPALEFCVQNIWISYPERCPASLQCSYYPNASQSDRFTPLGWT